MKISLKNRRAYDRKKGYSDDLPTNISNHGDGDFEGELGEFGGEEGSDEDDDMEVEETGN